MIQDCMDLLGHAANTLIPMQQIFNWIGAHKSMIDSIPPEKLQKYRTLKAFTTNSCKESDEAVFAFLSFLKEVWSDVPNPPRVGVLKGKSAEERLVEKLTREQNLPPR